jgi:hypothetical protein
MARCPNSLLGVELPVLSMGTGADGKISHKLLARAVATARNHSMERARVFGKWPNLDTWGY